MSMYRNETINGTTVWKYELRRDMKDVMEQ